MRMGEEYKFLTVSKESPYSKTLEIIKLAAENREAANIRLKKYVEKSG